VNLCGEVFTAPEPEGVGPEKYDETTAAMIALLKYGSGMPFYRFEKLEQVLGIPLPASTQWEIVEEAAEVIQTARDELIRQAAQDEVLHNDDTGMRVLREPAQGGKAITYLLRHWKGLTAFLREAGAPLDNNICERALKRAVLHRKNALFYRTLHGAEAGDLFMSLIHTCELAGANPFDYLTQLQRHASELAANPSAWMPWNSSESLYAGPGFALHLSTNYICLDTYILCGVY
jgi:hypothetical protein